MLGVLFSSPIVWGQEIHTTHADQKKVAITIYNNNLALVKDQRQVPLKKGENILDFMDVSTEIQPETALLRNLSHPQGFSIIEQNYESNSLTAHNLLQAYVGHQVGVIYRHPATGQETIKQATLLTANQGVILRFEDHHIETGISPNRLIYPAVPKDLRENPSLILQLHTAVAGKQTLELSYLTHGLSWKADYVARLNQAENHFDLNGWITLTNQSRMTYRNAHLQLVAGNVHQITPPSRYAKMQAREATPLAAAPPMPEEPLLGRHLYTLERATTIKSHQTKQIALLSANHVAVHKDYELRSYTPHLYNDHSHRSTALKPPVTLYLSFNNTEKAGLGRPLPAGIIRVYKQDIAGSLQFVGEDRINHLSKNSSTKLKLGQAFDITAQKRLTKYRRLDSNSFEATFEIQLHNAKKESVLVKVAEWIPGDWHILTENYPHQQETANIARWQLPVSAEGQTTLTVSFKTKESNPTP